MKLGRWADGKRQSLVSKPAWALPWQCAGGLLCPNSAIEDSRDCIDRLSHYYVGFSALMESDVQPGMLITRTRIRIERSSKGCLITWKRLCYYVIEVVLLRERSCVITLKQLPTEGLEILCPILPRTFSLTWLKFRVICIATGQCSVTTALFAQTMVLLTLQCHSYMRHKLLYWRSLILSVRPRSAPVIHRRRAIDTTTSCLQLFHVSHVLQLLGIFMHRGVFRVAFCNVSGVTFCSVARVTFCSVTRVTFCSVARITFCSVALVIFCSVARVTFETHVRLRFASVLFFSTSLNQTRSTVSPPATRLAERCERSLRHDVSPFVTPRNWIVKFKTTPGFSSGLPPPPKRLSFLPLHVVPTTAYRFGCDPYLCTSKKFFSRDREFLQKFTKCWISRTFILTRCCLLMGLNVYPSVLFTFLRCCWCTSPSCFSVLHLSLFFFLFFCRNWSQVAAFIVWKKAMVIYCIFAGMQLSEFCMYLLLRVSEFFQGCRHVPGGGGLSEDRLCIAQQLYAIFGVAFAKSKSRSARLCFRSQVLISRICFELS